MLAIYNRALTASEVAQNYLAGPDTAPDLLAGDVNCDGAVNFGDINAFVLLLSNPDTWQALYPDCPALNGDINGDGAVNFGDINPFVMLLSGS